METFEHGLGREGKKILRCDKLLSVSDSERVSVRRCHRDTKLAVHRPVASPSLPFGSLPIDQGTFGVSAFWGVRFSMGWDD